MGKASLIKSTTDRGYKSADGVLMELILDRIRPNPWNTKSKSRYSGREFDDLVASIEAKGLIQPILARPVEPDGGIDHEVVCGERRLRACQAIAAKNSGPGKSTILALVRDLSDDDAFDLTIIENLQRQDLDPLDEAQSFQKYLEKHGPDAAGDLADRVGVSAAYIHRRVAVLELPKPTLKAWQKGQMTYGHLEQLRRLKDKNQIARFVGEIVRRADGKHEWEGPMTVRELKHDIDMESPGLEKTIFDQKKTGCRQCYSNSSVQKKLFDSDEEELLKCLNPKCYKQNVNNHLSANWESQYKPEYGTNGFVFDSNVNYHEYKDILPVILRRGRVRAACKKCDKFLTIVEHDGSPRTKHICYKDKNCYSNTYEKKSSSSATVAGEDDQADEKARRRSENHGVEFRELFYADVLPDRLGSLTSHSAEILRVALIALTVIDMDVRWFVDEKLGIKDHWEDDTRRQAIFGLSARQAQDLAKDIAIMVTMKKVSPAARRDISDHIGIELAVEWFMTEDYLKKKTIAELLAIGADLGIFENAKVSEYMNATHGNAEFSKLKKKDLADVFLKSGIDLVGKVPAEILQ